jgi:RHS repeat-associated protein
MASGLLNNAYDAFNRLVGEMVTQGDGSWTKTAFAYDGNQIVLQFDGSGSPLPPGEGQGEGGPLTIANLSHRYLWGPAVDQLLADEKLQAASGGGSNLTTPGAVSWALTDNEGTVKDLAVYNTSTGTTSIENHRVLDAYGNVLTQTDMASGCAAAVDCVFGYTGKYFDQATGLQNNVERWYDPKTGRWLSQDPIGFWGGDADLYRYCGNNPTKYIDPSGMLLFPGALIQIPRLG